MTNKSLLKSEFARLSDTFEENLKKDDFPFERMLRDIVSYQHRHNADLAAFWHRRGFDGTQFDTLHDIPAVPTDVFRHVALVSSEDAPAGVFRTSGTTSGARGQHFYLSAAAYDAGAVRHFQDAVIGRDRRIHLISVAFDAATHPDSSLSHMLYQFGDVLGRDARSLDVYFDDDGLRSAALDRRLRAAEHEAEPVVVFGTAFGLADTMDALAPRALPSGSIVIQTGGFKGRRETLEPEAFYDGLSRHFGLPPDDILSEYGMTELGSQLYSDRGVDVRSAGASARRRLIAPPWCRVEAANPQTLEVLPDGERGLLRFSDCTNIGSVAVIQTSDVGIVHPDGLELMGRHPAGTPRGCSLAIEEIRGIHDASTH